MAEYPERSSSRTKPNYFYSIISVSLVLFLLGFFSLIILNAQRLIKVFKERVNLLVEIEEGAPDEAIAQFGDDLKKRRYTLENSVRFIPREEAEQMMQEEFGEDFLKLDLPNPFFDVYLFNVQAAFMAPDSLTTIRNELRNYSFVHDVYYQESLIDEISRNVRRIGFFSLGVGLFFILVAVTLIHNTIRLALYSNRFLIKNMELVGASWKFISRPYLLRAVGHGFLSGLLAAAALAGLMYWAVHDLPELHSLFDPLAYGILFGGLLVLGIIITTMSTYYVVNKYLRMRVDDLY